MLVVVVANRAGVHCREFARTQLGQQIQSVGLLSLRRHVSASAISSVLPAIAQRGAGSPMALRARQRCQQLLSLQRQHADTVADKWSQLEVKLITLVNSLSLTTAGQVSTAATCNGDHMHCF